MIVLATATTVLQVVTSSTSALDVSINGTIFPDALLFEQDTAITSATTTDIADAPAASKQHLIKNAAFRNKGGAANTITIQRFNGTNTFELFKVTLAAGEMLIYDDANNWTYYNSLGQSKTSESTGGSQAAVNALNLVVLAADVINSNAVANTIADVTGLSFAVVAGETYWFRAIVRFSSAATTTGSRWSVNGPAAPTALVYRSNYSLTAATETLNAVNTAYDLPAASNATCAATVGNVAFVEGYITPSANGAVTIRFASEVANSAITAKAGSILKWVRTL